MQKVFLKRLNHAMFHFQSRGLRSPVADFCSQRIVNDGTRRVEDIEEAHGLERGAFLVLAPVAHIARLASGQRAVLCKTGQRRCDIAALPQLTPLALRLWGNESSTSAPLFQTAGSKIKNVGTRAWSNMGGEIRVQHVQLTDAYLGSTAWGTQDVFVLPDGGNPPAGVHGLLGMSSLKARRVRFDPGQKIIAWDRESGPEQIARAAR